MALLYNDHKKDFADIAHNWIMSKYYSALWVEMGLGKTVITLTAVEELLDAFKSKNILVASPLRVAKLTWPEEIQKWSHTCNIPFSVIPGKGATTEAKRIKALNSKAPIHIVNYENIVWMVKYILAQTGGRWPYDTIVVDESSMVKHQSSKRHKAINHIRPATERMIQLTGSPAPNGLLNLWGQLYLMDRGERLGNTYDAMKKRWWRPVAYNDYGPTYQILPGASNEIHERVSDIALSMRTKDYMDYQDDITVPVYVELPTKLKEQYDELEAKMFLELDKATITAANGGALTNKCRQFTNGFLYDIDKNVHRLHEEKIKALEEIIEGNEGQPILLSYQYQADRDLILERFPQAELFGEDQEQVDRWNQGLIPLLILHPKSAGHGLNLQFGGHLIVFFGLDWDLEKYEQPVARLSKRHGQNYPVIIYLILMKDTVDELMLMRIKDKDEVQVALKNFVSRYQKLKLGLV